jgi:hypothetical protein
MRTSKLWLLVVFLTVFLTSCGVVLDPNPTAPQVPQYNLPQNTPSSIGLTNLALYFVSNQSFVKYNEYLENPVTIREILTYLANAPTGNTYVPNEIVFKATGQIISFYLNKLPDPTTAYYLAGQLVLSFSYQFREFYFYAEGQPLAIAIKNAPPIYGPFTAADFT